MERSLYAYEYVNHALSDIVDLLTTTPESVLQPATDDAHGRIRHFVERLHVDVRGFELGRDVVVELGERQPLDRDAETFPLAWHAAESAGLFPALSGHLEVAALSFHPPLCQVSFIGRYRPPLGLVGAVADSIAGKRVAEAAVHHFVEQLTSRLEAQLTTAEVPARAAGTVHAQR